MIELSRVEHIFIANGATDLRMGIDGYASIVAGNFKQDVFSKSIFLFCNRNKDKLKILYWDNNGFWLCYKRLEEGKFKWLKQQQSESTEINQQQLRWLLEGLSMKQEKAFKKVEGKAI